MTTKAAAAQVRDWTVTVTWPAYQHYGPFTRAEAAVCAAAQKHPQSVFAARLTPWPGRGGAGETA